MHIHIAAQECWRIKENKREVDGYNERRDYSETTIMTLRGWTWFRHSGGNTLVGREKSAAEYGIRAVKKNNICVIDAEELRPEDRNEIAKYNGKYLVGFMGLEERDKIQIVVENV